MATVAKPAVFDRPAWTARLHEWVVTVDHKRIGIMYVLMAVVFLVIAGLEALAIRWQLVHARQQFSRARHVQSVLHDARHDDGVFRRHADFDRHRQLRGAAADRRPRHGVSADQRVRILGHAVRRLVGVFQFFRSRRAAGDRLVCLRSADGAHVCPRRRRRFLGAGLTGQRHRHDRGRREFRRHDSYDALPRHDAGQAAVLHLDDALDRACKFCWRFRR